MNLPVPLAGVVTAAFIMGGLAGAAVLAPARSGLVSARVVGLAGVILLAVGLFAGGADRRFLALAGVGVGLHLAWLVNSFSKKAVAARIRRVVARKA